MQKIKIAILISGRGSNMQALIRACRGADFPAEVALVVSNKAEAQGLEFAREQGIEAIFIDHKKFISRAEFDRALGVEIAKRNCKIVCLAGFMRLLSAEFVNEWRGKVINIHPSLLPEFKGADAVGDAIKAGAKKSGCTVHFVVEEMDAGPIIMQAAVDVLSIDNKETLAAKILQKEHELYPQALALVCEGMK